LSVLHSDLLAEKDELASPGLAHRPESYRYAFTIGRTSRNARVAALGVHASKGNSVQRPLGTFGMSALPALPTSRNGLQPPAGDTEHPPNRAGPPLGILAAKAGQVEDLAGGRPVGTLGVEPVRLGTSRQDTDVPRRAGCPRAMLSTHVRFPSRC
jgi:hypothetical protein